MKTIGRSTVILLVVGLLGVMVMPAAALGRTRTTVTSHRVNLTGQIETLSSTGSVGSPGVQDTDSGILDGTVSGSPRWQGALRQLVTWGSDLAITAKGTAFDAAGSLRFTLSGKFSARAGGGLTLTGELTVTGGTGSYRHARGTLQVTGIASVKSGTTSSTFDLTGRLRYPRQLT